MSRDSVIAAYARLDKVMEQAPMFVNRRVERINKVKKELSAASDFDVSYKLSYQLYELYSPYVLSEGCKYLSSCINIAETVGHKDTADHCRAKLAKFLVGSGFYDEAREYLNQLAPTRLDTEGRLLYDVACRALYGELAYYTTLPRLKAKYDSLSQYYEKAFMPILPKNSDLYYMYRQNELMSQGEFEEALKLNSLWLRRTPASSHDYAMVTLYRYLAYKALGDSTAMMYWVAQSAINDIEQGVTDQSSIWELSNQLMLKGDLERAYRYISFASHCANTYGARQRKWQVEPLMTYLADTYKTSSEKSQHRLIISIAALSVFFAITLLLLVIAIRQRNHVKQTRNLLYKSNAQLKDSNDLLADSNRQLEESNDRLVDSNRVKEEYIGRFLEMCSLYVNRIDNIKKRTARYLKNKQYGELERIIHNKDKDDEEASELYKSFDSAFIHLFPHFVSDINDLLKPEAQLRVEKDGQFSTSLRIFALIRLGITDSSKIAEFLHYSVNTIYNYRARVKKGAIDDKNDFEEKVKKIGMSTKISTTNENL